MAWVQFPVSRSPKMTLVVQVFALAVAVVAPLQSTVGPKAFTIDKALDIPLCEKINDTLRFF
jgi:hypothetical protein